MLIATLTGFLSVVDAYAQDYDIKELQNLLRLVEGNDVLAGAEAIQSIGEYGPRATAITSALLCALDQHIKLRYQAPYSADFFSAVFSSFVAIGPAVIPIIVRELSDDPYSPFGVLSNGEPCLNPDAEARRAGAAELGADDDRTTLELFLSRVMREFGAEALPALIDALASPGYHRFAVIQSIGSLGQEGRGAVPVLVDLLEDTEPMVRGSAARALGEIGVATADVTTALQNLLEDQDQWVREEAARALDSLRKH